MIQRHGIVQIKLYSSQAFSVFEIAATTNLPKEFVLFDLGKPKDISWIEARHWSGKNTLKKCVLYAGTDKINWKPVQSLPVDGEVLSVYQSPQMVKAQYLKLEFTINDKDWEKAVLWELKVYDEHGPYGAFPPPKQSKHRLADIMGVNGIWGWGYNKHSDELKPGQGPAHFNKVANHARNYHNLNWDITHPYQTPGYRRMAEGKGTQALDWVNWDREYKAWQKAGLSVQASIQFENETQAQEIWGDAFQAAYNYGKAFALHFGKEQGNGLVNVVEVGNEPWDYDAGFYRSILGGMAKGIKEADKTMVVLPCALQSGLPAMEQTDFKNYMGLRISEQEAPYLDGLNVHYYSYINNPDGSRKAVHPEHPQSTFRGILNDIRFRNINMPGKAIYLSEWGWDSKGVGEVCDFDVCVTEEAQALYAVRGALMMMRLGIDKVIWFFYANLPESPTLYNRSGLTSTLNKGFQNKKSFVAFQAIRHHIGQSYFLNTIREDEKAYIYLFGNKTGQPTHLVVWQPAAAENLAVQNIPLKMTNKLQGYNIQHSYLIKGKNSQGEAIANPVFDPISKELNLQVSTAPLVLKIGKE